MLEGVMVDESKALQVALERVAALLKENIFLEAAVTSSQEELSRLRDMVPKDEEVTEDAIR